MKSQVFRYVLFFNPDSDCDGLFSRASEIIAEGTVVAKDITKAQLLAGRLIPESWIDDLDDIEVLVRPF